MKKENICRLGVKICKTVLFLQLIVFAALFIFINNFASKSVRDSAVSNMQTAAFDRSEIIQNYINSTEDTLTAYLKADQIYDLLRDPSNENNAAAAQKYTENFSKDLSNLEGIYASNWDTMMLTHTNPGVIGRVTRPDEGKRKQLHDAILATNGVYNTGIIISPAGGEQIISMYKAVREEDGTHIGLGGIGIYTSGLVEKLNGLALDGLSSAQYYLVNADTGEYIFHPDINKIMTTADEQFVIDIIADNSKPKGTVSYRDENGIKMTAAFNRLEQYNWLFILADPESEVLASVTKLKWLLILIFAVSAAALTAAVYTVINRLSAPLKEIEKSVVKLSGIELDAAESIGRYADRNDEIGSIAKSVCMMCISLKNATSDIGRILGEMAEENFAVDVDKNRNYYIGDFSILLENLKTIKEKLSNVLTNINIAAKQVNSGAEKVALGAQSLANGAEEQNSSIGELSGNLRNIEKGLKSNFDSCSEAHTLMNKTMDYVTEVNSKMEMLTSAMNNINEVSTEISNIIRSIEDIAFQTNILALNASIEAARAGDAGKGFSVVANEVRNLAAKASESAGDTAKLIESSSQAVSRGAEITDQTADAMRQLDEYTLSVKKIIDSITESGQKQTDMVVRINEDLTGISGVVNANSATAEESAAASEELSGQAALLKDLIGNFKL